MTQPLFRPEVTAAHSQQWGGAIRLAQPLSGWLSAGIALVLAGALIGYVTLGSITKKARVTGITLPVGGSISIAAPNAGLLIHSHVSEGQTVRAGQTLFELSNERQGSQGEITVLVAQQLATRQQTLESEQRLRLAQHNDQKQALSQKINNLSTEASQLEQEIALTKRRHSFAQDSVNKYQTLQANGFVSAAQTQQKQEELIDIATRLSNLQRSKLQLQANTRTIQAAQTALTNSLATDQAQLQRALASLQQEIAENHNRKASLITASQAGTITTLSSQTGQTITAGQILATLLPDPACGEALVLPAGAAVLPPTAPAPPLPAPHTASIPAPIKVPPTLKETQAPQSDCIDTNMRANSTTAIKHPLEAHLYAPSRTAGFVATGQAVLIRYQAYPYQKFGLQQGIVTDISKTPFAPNELPPSLASTILSNAQQNILGFNSNEALYRIKVKLDKQHIDAYGQAHNLRPGMTLEADVLQDKRKIWEWILEPVLAVSQRE